MTDIIARTNRVYGVGGWLLENSEGRERLGLESIRLSYSAPGIRKWERKSVVTEYPKRSEYR